MKQEKTAQIQRMTDVVDRMYAERVLRSKIGLIQRKEMATTGDFLVELAADMLVFTHGCSPEQTKTVLTASLENFSEYAELSGLDIKHRPEAIDYRTAYDMVSRLTSHPQDMAGRVIPQQIEKILHDKRNFAMKDVLIGLAAMKLMACDVTPNKTVDMLTDGMKQLRNSLA